MDVRDGRLGCWQEIELTHARSVQSFLNGVGLVFELRELAYPEHAIAANDERRRYLGITVLASVEVEQELNESAFQARTPARIEEKTTSRQFRSPIEIHQL